jgi:hypothetical protein
VALVDQIEQAAGGGHQHIHAAAHRIDLRHLADAAIDERLAEADVFAIGGEALAHLRGELAGGCQHQGAAAARAHLARVFMQRLQDRQGEAGGLAGAGLGAA